MTTDEWIRKLNDLAAEIDARRNLGPHAGKPDSTLHHLMDQYRELARNAPDDQPKP